MFAHCLRREVGQFQRIGSEGTHTVLSDFLSSMRGGTRTSKRLSAMGAMTGKGNYISLKGMCQVASSFKAAMRSDHVEKRRCTGKDRLVCLKHVFRKLKLPRILREQRHAMTHSGRFSFIQNLKQSCATWRRQFATTSPEGPL